MNLHFGGAMPLPVQGEIAEDESGMGYALRMAGENYLSFSDVAIDVGSDSRNYLPHRAAKRIAFLFGGNPVRIAEAFQDSFKLNSMTVGKMMGHVFFRSYHLRQHFPQICPACLWKYRRTFVWWDITLVTVCPEHRVRLIDSCPHCLRRVSWRRPSILLCQCGSIFADDAQMLDRATEQEIWLTSQIRNLLCPKATLRIMIFQSAYSFLEGLSLDQLLRLIWAFGILPDGTVSIAAGKMSRILRTADAADLIGRAFSRLHDILQDTPALAGNLRVHKSALRAMLEESEVWNEANLISLLLHLVAKSEHGKEFGVTFQEKLHGQLGLFGSHYE